MPGSGYQEFAHTADWGMHVWAEDLTSLLVTAAEGMFDLLDVIAAPQDQLLVSFRLPAASSPEALLVDFLNELLFLSDREQIGFDNFDVTISHDQLEARVSGGKLIAQSKEIKAVTFHMLAVETTERGVEARLVFDV